MDDREGRNKKLPVADESDLRWYFRESAAAVSGLQGQAYEPGIDCSPDPDDDLVRAFGRVGQVKRIARIESIQARVLLRSASAWGTLSAVYGPPRRSDPWQDFYKEPELAPLVRYVSSLRHAAHRVLVEEEKELGSPRSAFAEDEIGRAAIRVWEHAQRRAKDPGLIATARIEARQLYAEAASAYRAAKDGLRDAEREEDTDSKRRILAAEVRPLSSACERILASTRAILEMVATGLRPAAHAVGE